MSRTLVLSYQQMKVGQILIGVLLGVGIAWVVGLMISKLRSPAA